MPDVSREQQIRERLEKATPGPWVCFPFGGLSGPEEDQFGWEVSQPYCDSDPCDTKHCSNTVLRTGDCDDDFVSSADVALIANAPSDLAYLLQENERLRAVADAAAAWAVAFGAVPDEAYYSSEEIALYRAVEATGGAR